MKHSNNDLRFMRKNWRKRKNCGKIPDINPPPPFDQTNAATFHFFARCTSMKRVVLAGFHGQDPYMGIRSQKRSWLIMCSSWCRRTALAFSPFPQAKERIAGAR